MTIFFENKQQGRHFSKSFKKNKRLPRPLKLVFGFVSLLPPFYGLAIIVLRLGHILPLLVYTTMSIISFSFYGYDKHRANNAGWRIRENMLHLLDLSGGWPGGFFGQLFFRHKLRKVDFQVVFWLSMVIHEWFWLNGVCGIGRNEGQWGSWFPALLEVKYLIEDKLHEVKRSIWGIEASDRPESGIMPCYRLPSFRTGQMNVWTPTKYRADGSLFATTIIFGQGVLLRPA
ncbi:hypothetical protein FKW77_002806 [Venturia effusa]|uniref:DUF1294 domain-containing protein n=1 Tax=Venturia effusa TaxID=50376 RepID=A0A517L4Z7_9PEZI|nr:hypothetical protein FKW77_002806 [Venturia effusa]